MFVLCSLPAGDHGIGPCIHNSPKAKERTHGQKQQTLVGKRLPYPPCWEDHGPPPRDTSLHPFFFDLLRGCRTKLIFNGPEHPFHKDTAAEKTQKMNGEDYVKLVTCQTQGHMHTPGPVAFLSISSLTGSIPPMLLPWLGQAITV